MKEEYWRTKDGRKIAVSDLTEDHAKNIIRMIIKSNRKLFDSAGQDSWESKFWDDFYRYGSGE